MSGSAPYEVNVSGSDDETFAFSLPFENTDGTPFDFDAYVVEYVVSSDGGGRYLFLTDTSGITIGDSILTIQADRGRVRPGVYSHGCRLREIATGFEFQVFDGTVTISEGAFR